MCRCCCNEEVSESRELSARRESSGKSGKIAVAGSDTHAGRQERCCDGRGAQEVAGKRGPQRGSFDAAATKTQRNREKKRIMRGRAAETAKMSFIHTRQASDILVDGAVETSRNSAQAYGTQSCTATQNTQPKMKTKKERRKSTESESRNGCDGAGDGGDTHASTVETGICKIEFGEPQKESNSLL